VLVKYLSRKNWNLAWIAASAVILGACGANHVDTGDLFKPLNGPTITCSSGQITLDGRCYSTNDFATACMQALGTMRGAELCEMDSMATQQGVIRVPTSDKGHFSMTVTWDNMIMPRLNPGNPNISAALPSGIRVRPGDRIEFEGNGRWGSWSSCKYADQDGNKISDGTTLDPIDGVPEGLVIGNGIESFFVGGTSTVAFNSEGTVGLGFNAPYDKTNGCSDLTIHEFRLIHCENSAGVTYPCP
jgi:hypothetical protein